MEQVFMHQNLDNRAPEKEQSKSQEISSALFLCLTETSAAPVRLLLSCLTLCPPSPAMRTLCDAPNPFSLHVLLQFGDQSSLNGSDKFKFCVRLMISCDFIKKVAGWFFRQKAKSQSHAR